MKRFNEGVLLLSEEFVPDVKVGDIITVAECGGVSLSPNSRFKWACSCGHDCHCGSHPMVEKIIVVPAEVVEMEEEAYALKRAYHKKLEEIESRVSALFQ